MWYGRFPLTVPIIVMLVFSMTARRNDGFAALVEDKGFVREKLLEH